MPVKKKSEIASTSQRLEIMFEKHAEIVDEARDLLASLKNTLLDFPCHGALTNPMGARKATARRRLAPGRCSWEWPANMLTAAAGS